MKNTIKKVMPMRLVTLVRCVIRDRHKRILRYESWRYLHKRKAADRFK